MSKVKGVQDKKVTKVSTLAVKMEKKLDVPADKLEEYKEAFDMFDRDHSGAISVDEIYKIMKQFGNEMSKKEIKAMISDIDADGSGELDFEEFVTFMSRTYKQLDDEEAVILAFKTFDKNKDGKISLDEFRYILSQLGRKLSDSTIRAIFRESDIDKDNELNIEEFVNFWKNI